MTRALKRNTCKGVLFGLDFKLVVLIIVKANSAQSQGVGTRYSSLVKIKLEKFIQVRTLACTQFIVGTGHHKAMENWFPV